MEYKMRGNDHTVVWVLHGNGPILSSLPWRERVRERGKRPHFITLTLALSPQGRGKILLKGKRHPWRETLLS
jgi:hypothetical protein